MAEPAGGSRPRQEGALRSRLADADRDGLLVLLREHYAQGRLSLDELERRAGIVLAAEFADEVAAIMLDLPPLSASPGAGRGSAEKGQVARPPRGRHAQAAAPAPGWLPTEERFRDPSSGKIMRVWIDPADQARHYVPDT